MHFGEHLTIDGYGGSKDKLNDNQLIINLLNDLPKIMEMHPISKPEVFLALGNDIKDPGGWSGFVLIQESHISIHTFPLRGFLSADVYTCKNGLDTNLIISYFKKHFELNSVESNLIKRGMQYPNHNIY